MCYSVHGDMVIKTTQADIDYADGYKALRRLEPQPPVRAAQMHPLLRWLTLVGTLIILLHFLNSPTRSKAAGLDHALEAWAIPLMVCFAALAATDALRPLVSQLAPGLLLPKQPPSPLEITIDERGICCDTEHVRTMYQWSFFSRYAESAKSFALEGKRLNAAPILLLVMPKAAVPGGQQMDDLRRMLHDHVLPEAARAAQGSTGFPIAAPPPLPLRPSSREDPLPNHAPDDASLTRMDLLEGAQYEYDDLAVASVGWRPRVDRSNQRVLLIILMMEAAGIVVSTIAGIVAATHLPLLIGVLIVPAMKARAYVRSIAAARRSLAGHQGLWRRHVLSYGPAAVRLSLQGIVLRTVHSEMLLKTGSPVVFVESQAAFSLIARNREIILPRRLLSPEAIPHIRESLISRFGPPIIVPPGRVLRIAPPADNPVPKPPRPFVVEPSGEKSL